MPQIQIFKYSFAIAYVLELDYKHKSHHFSNTKHPIVFMVPNMWIYSLHPPRCLGACHSGEGITNLHIPLYPIIIIDHHV